MQGNIIALYGSIQYRLLDSNTFLMIYVILNIRHLILRVKLKYVAILVKHFGFYLIFRRFSLIFGVFV